MIKRIGHGLFLPLTPHEEKPHLFLRNGASSFFDHITPFEFTARIKGLIGFFR
jgi:hypothetical protein